MISELKPYEVYKESGLPWLGQVPLHWQLERTKWRFRHRKVLNTAGASTNVLSLTLRGVVNNNPDDPEGLVPKDYRTYQLFTAGDLVFKLIDLENLRTSRVGLVHEDGIMSSAYVRLVPSRPLNRSYFYHQFFDLYSRGVYNQLGAGVRSTLGPTDLLNITIAFPPLAEQAAIVRFLDWANGRLERAIRAKRKIIALLNEQKQAIIHHVVTRGLDSSAPLKDSGVPWLGEIPKHWRLKRFKFLARINTGQVDPRRSEYRDLVLIAPNHVQSGSGRLLTQETANAQGADSGKYLVRAGQVIYSKIRPNLRKATIAPCDCLCSADMYPMEPTSGEISADYLLLLLLSHPFTKFAVDTSMRVAMPKINREALADCLMWYPDLNEQSSILKFIAHEASPIDTAISRLESEITLLREYRTRLFADVVTGRLDVRAAAAALPDEAPLDDTTASPDTDDALNSEDLPIAEASE